MENPLETARRVLTRHDAPALPYTELHRLVSSEIAGPAPRNDQLLRRIRRRPDLFCTLDPRRGAWRALADATSGSEPYPWLEPWVLLAAPDDVLRARDGAERGSGPGNPEVGARASRLRLPRVRETVLHLGRNLDGASSTSLSRWLLIVREEHAVRERIRSGSPSV